MVSNVAILELLGVIRVLTSQYRMLSRLGDDRRLRNPPCQYGNEHEGSVSPKEKRATF